jgi:hypothetical protein
MCNLYILSVFKMSSLERNDDSIRKQIGSKLLQLIHKYPDKLWSSSSVSYNRNIYLEHVIAYSEYNWDFQMLSMNTNLSIEWILHYPQKPWNWSFVSEHKNICMKDIESHMHMPWNWLYVSKNPNISLEFIEKYPDLPWNWAYISKSIQPDEITKNPSAPWKWSQISFNKQISTEFIEAYIHKDWNWRALSWNHNLNETFLVKYFDKPWDREGLYFIFRDKIHALEEKYPTYNWNFLRNHEEYDEDYEYGFIDYLEDTYDLNVILQTNPKSYDYYELFYKLSLCDQITFGFIEMFIDKTLNFELICSDDFNYEYDTMLHKQSMKEVLEELLEFVYNPDNIYRFMVRNKLLDDITICDWNLG